MSKVAIVWLRRNLRLEDNKPFAAALRSVDKVLPIFIFDTTILSRFQNPYDRRLSFLANTLCLINEQLKNLQGELLVLYGTPLKVIPKLTNLLKIEAIYADQDYEPANIERDQKIQKLLADRCTLHLYSDHLLIKPGTILTSNSTPYKLYTPYMHAFREHIMSKGPLAQNGLLTKYRYELAGRLLRPTTKHLRTIDLSLGAREVLKQIGYIYRQDDLWDPKNGYNALASFTQTKIDHYKTDRDFLHLNGTSKCSPYLRFGLISIRSCYRKALALEANLGITTWVNELIWREFYTNILYHFPHTVQEAFQEKYRGTIPWNNNPEDYEKLIKGQTGYPIIDAAVQQLLQEGWMHNRARMIVASFFTKNLLLDWRKGESFFCDYLMDYELASNIGGWQWASSCGTDAQPYFRIFNPYLQGKKFDPNATYIKKYLPNLQTLSANLIHSSHLHKTYRNYPKPMLDYDLSRIRAIATFKKATQG